MLDKKGCSLCCSEVTCESKCSLTRFHGLVMFVNGFVSLSVHQDLYYH